MNKNKSNDIQHLKHMLAEILPYCTGECHEIQDWPFNNSKVSFNFKWEKEASPIIFENKIFL